jgi:preprotein translocase subunit SecA
MIDQQIDRFLDDFLSKDYGATTFAKFAGGELGVELEPNDFRGLDYETAERQAKDEAERKAEGQVFEAIDENLPDDAEQDEWNWEALAKLIQTRWRLNLRDRDLKKVPRQELGEFLIQKAREALQEVDLAEGKRFLEPDFGLRTACGWVHYKFGIELDPEDVRGLELGPFKELVRRKAEGAYAEKETEYPVLAGLYHFTTRDASGQKRYDRERLVTWARERFHVDLDLEDLRNKQRDEIRALLLDHSREYQRQAEAALTEVQQQVTKVFSDDGHTGRTLGQLTGGNGALTSLASWLEQKWAFHVSPEELAELDRAALEQKLSSAVEDHFRPEIRRMERSLLLQILDTAWKDHLLAMDHLRSSVGLRGYAQVDPKVEYKREGMRIFEQMWASVGERVTDLIFRMEQLDEGFVGSTWVESQAVHDSPPPGSSMISDDQTQAISGSDTPQKSEPIRNRNPQIGRNDPCPCGSGKKYKNCHMRTGGM